MSTKFDWLKRHGQGLVEYILILAVISAVTILTLSLMGSQVDDTFSKIGSGLGG